MEPTPSKASSIVRPTYTREELVELLQQKIKALEELIHSQAEWNEDFLNDNEIWQSFGQTSLRYVMDDVAELGLKVHSGLTRQLTSLKVLNVIGEKFPALSVAWIRMHACMCHAWLQSLPFDFMYRECCT